LPYLAAMSKLRTIMPYSLVTLANDKLATMSTLVWAMMPLEYNENTDIYNTTSYINRSQVDTINIVRDYTNVAYIDRLREATLER
jgi:hypothetical protein